jgi:hypothetical protein
VFIYLFKMPTMEALGPLKLYTFANSAWIGRKGRRGESEEGEGRGREE